MYVQLHNLKIDHRAVNNTKERSITKARKDDPFTTKEIGAIAICTIISAVITALAVLGAVSIVEMFNLDINGIFLWALILSFVTPPLFISVFAAFFIAATGGRR